VEIFLLQKAGHFAKGIHLLGEKKILLSMWKLTLSYGMMEN
jgi:hypothetical protein